MKQLLIALLGFPCFLVHAQPIFDPAGAAAWGSGGCAVTTADAWSVLNNPAAAAGLKRFHAGLSSEQRFHESKLALAGAAVVMPSRWINTGLSAHHFGYSLFNQQKLSASFSKQLFSQLSLGVTLSYFSTNISEQPHAGSILGEAGLLYRISSKLKLGLFLFNPTRSKYAEQLQERIPTFVRLGLAHDVSDKLQLTAETEQVLDRKTVWRGGVRYQLHEILSLAVGASNNPVYYTFGTGIRLKAFRMDFAASMHEVLGLTPHLGLSYPVQ